MPIPALETIFNIARQPSMSGGGSWVGFLPSRELVDNEAGGGSVKGEDACGSVAVPVGIEAREGSIGSGVDLITNGQ
jgi:hypothetical protein